MVVSFQRYGCLLLGLVFLLLDPVLARDVSVGVVVHQAQGEETPAEIAELYGVQLERLEEINDLSTFQAGSLLQIPLSPANWPFHTVESGQTLWRIGAGYGIPVEQLVQANQLTDTRLMPGQRLRLPRAKRPEWSPPPLPQIADQPPIPAPSVAAHTGTVLESQPEGWVEVSLPDSRRVWVRAEDLVLGSWEPKGRVELIRTARAFTGTPYKWGGTNPNGYDCSGFVQEVFRLAGHSVPRMADVQYEKLQKVEIDALEPGDLVFFNTDGSGVSHVGIYSGDGKFLHASSSRGVIESALSQSYYEQRYVGGARVDTL